MTKEQKNVGDLSVQELKAIAYDLVVQITNAQNALNTINAELAKREQDAQAAPKNGSK